MARAANGGGLRPVGAAVTPIGPENDHTYCCGCSEVYGGIGVCPACLKEYGTPPRNMTTQDRQTLDLFIEIRAANLRPPAAPGTARVLVGGLAVIVAAAVFLVLSPAIVTGLIVYGWLKDIREPASQRRARRGVA